MSRLVEQLVEVIKVHTGESVVSYDICRHFFRNHGGQLIALLEAGKAARDLVHCDADLLPNPQRQPFGTSHWCQCDGCAAVRAYDKAAK